MRVFSFRGLDAVLYKETLHALRDPATIFLALGIPIFQLLLFGYAFDVRTEYVRTVIYDEDRGDSATRFRDALAASHGFRIVGTVRDHEAMREAIIAGRARVGVEIPPHFTADLRAGRPAAVQVLIDGSDSNIAQQAYSSALAVGGTLAPSSARGPDVRVHVMFNPSLRAANFYVPGLVGLILQNITMMLTALSIVGERERGTLEQLLVTPIAPAALLLGKIIPYAVIGIIDFASVLVAMRWVFAVPIAGSIPLLCASAAIFIVVALGMGIFISTVSRTQLEALLRSIALLLPSILLSGFFIERELMPPVMQWLGLVLPLTYFLEILRGIIGRGAGIVDLRQPLIAISVLGLCIFTLATVRFSAMAQGGGAGTKHRRKRLHDASEKT
ncbi:MAG TPA: ABC transporter permease [Candidatus Baltobacteraceae bacterium]|jgi:ABC-type multidrug transport system permease subunit|nr:ABC transporter permease [Candidatus Baltobacteraceae bacterium]